MYGAARFDELRFVEQQSVTSAANELYVQSGAVPSGKIWTVIAAHYYVSAGETRELHFGRVTRAGTFIAHTYFGSLAVTVDSRIPGVPATDPMILFPGERLQFQRVGFTAASTISLQWYFIQTDMPFMKYHEPQREIVTKKGVYLRGFGGARGGGRGEGGGGSAPETPGGGLPGEPLV